MSLLPAQCRAARGLLDWSQADLSEASKVAPKTLADFERGHLVPYVRVLAAIRAAFETGGLVFVDENGEGPGVRLKNKRSVETLASEIETLDLAHAEMGAAPSPTKALNRMQAALATNKRKALAAK